MSTSALAQPRTLRRVTHPTHKTIPSIPLYDVTPEGRHRLTIVSPQVHSVYIHMDGKRTLPCYGKDKCTCDYGHLPIKTNHYLYVVAPGSSKVRLLKITNGLIYQELPQLVEDGRDLRGMVVELRRAFAGKRDSAMLGVIVEESGEMPPIGNVPDIEWAVDRLVTAPPRLTPWVSRSPGYRPPPTMPAQTDPILSPEDRAKRIAELVEQYRAGPEARKLIVGVLRSLGVKPEEVLQ